MNDREMLELAAKAAGIAGHYITNYNRDYYCQGNTEGILYECPNGRLDVWNPLTDDGDALRLAVKLNLPIHRSHITDARLPVVACHKLYENVHEEERWQWEFVKDDPYTATRRAIVRAAAEIGRKHEH